MRQKKNIHPGPRRRPRPWTLSHGVPFAFSLYRSDSRLSLGCPFYFLFISFFAFFYRRVGATGAVGMTPKWLVTLKVTRTGKGLTVFTVTCNCSVSISIVLRCRYNVLAVTRTVLSTVAGVIEYVSCVPRESIAITVNGLFTRRLDTAGCGTAHMAHYTLHSRVSAHTPVTC